MSLFRKKTVHSILKQVEKDNADDTHKLGKHLGVRDLTAFGIAAIVGAGIFSTIGQASADGGVQQHIHLGKYVRRELLQNRSAPGK